MSNSRFAAPVAVALAFAAPALANDSSPGVPAGTLRADPAGGLQASAARIALDADQVSVTWTIDAKAAAKLRLDLPRFGWLGEAEPYPDRQFPELKAELDGRTAALEDAPVILAKGQDVTAQVLAAGLDPYAIADTPPLVDPVAGRQAAFDALVTSGAIGKAQEGDLAGWTVARRIAIGFAPGHHRLTLRYKARPAFALEVAPAKALAEVCLTPKAAATLQARHGLKGPVLVQRFAIPVTLAGAKPPALTFQAAPGKAAIVVCGVKGTATMVGSAAVAARPGPDGALHVLRLARPGA